jgi:chorismate mutase
MKKGLWIFLSLLITIEAQAIIVNGNFYGRVQGNPRISGTAIEGYSMLANRYCKDISCVQQNIKLIDSQIADLLARRLAFVKRGAELKNSAIVSGNVQLGPNNIMEVTRQAQAQGYPPEIAQAVFQEINRQSEAFEDKYRNMTPQPSPNSLGIPTRNVNNPVVTPTITPGLGRTPTIVPGAH